MNENLQEQAYWLLLVFESKLPKRVINDIVMIWCQQLGRTLREFFTAQPQEWTDTCHLDGRYIEKLEKAKLKHADQVSLVQKLSHHSISLLTVLDSDYPQLLKSIL